MKYVGVGGCLVGWLAASLTEGKMEVAVFRSFHAFWNAHRDAKVILVDIPIGLPGKTRPDRIADSLARKELGLRHGAMFSPGTREILECADYKETRVQNRQLTGKKISLQY